MQPPEAHGHECLACLPPSHAATSLANRSSADFRCADLSGIRARRWADHLHAGEIPLMGRKASLIVW